MSKAMSLKAKIHNIAKQKNIPAQVILQNRTIGKNIPLIYKLNQMVILPDNKTYCRG